MAAFSGLYDSLIMDSVGIREPISDIQDQKSQYDVSKHLADQQYIEFAREYGVISSEEALMSWYESTMESFGLQEVIDPIIINQDYVSEALYGPSFGVDNGERVVDPETESTVNEKIQDCDVNHLQKYTPGNGENQEVTIDKGKCIDKPLRSKAKGKGHTTHGKTKKRKNDQYVGGSVVEIYLQKSKRGRCKCSQSSSACKSHEKKSNTKLDVIRTDPPEMPLRIVKADGQKDYIHLRARRGQATNSHSLAERARREKISERMKILQELVPGCNKVAGTTLVLEEIIYYVQSLQKQVEILCLKLACVFPLCDSGLEVNGHLSTEGSNLKQVHDIHGITMRPQTMERF